MTSNTDSASPGADDPGSESRAPITGTIHVLGIDAGGTKTVCQLADGQGTLVAEVRGPGANLQAAGDHLRELPGRMLARGLNDPSQPVWADAIETLRSDAEIVELADGIGLEVDADPERLRIPHGLEDDAGHADLVQRERGGEAADAAAGNEHGS